MKVILDIPYFLGALVCFALGYSIITYKIDKYVHFAGEANALGCFVITFVMGFLLLVCSFERIKSTK
jgi:uncharacterized membrane protein